MPFNHNPSERRAYPLNKKKPKHNPLFKGPLETEEPEKEATIDVGAGPNPEAETEAKNEEEQSIETLLEERPQKKAQEQPQERPQKLFTCYICGKQFKKEQALKVHMTRMHGE